MGASESTMASPEVKQLVDGKIAGKKVMVFSKGYCSFCKKVKGIFNAHMNKDLKEEDYDVMEIENDPNMDAIQGYLQQLTGGRSVPRVFINGKSIGGCDDTQALERSGQLAKLLSS